MNNPLEETIREAERMRADEAEAAKDPGLYESYSREVFAPFGEVVFQARKRGRSHVLKGKPCQDYCLSARGMNCVILTAADGVGSCEKSDIGSRLACEIAVSTIKSAEQHSGSEQDFLSVLCGVKFRERLVKRWLATVMSLVEAEDAPSGEKMRLLRQYASTLMWVVITGHWYAAGNLGDGQILFFHAEDGLKLRLHKAKESSRVRALVHEKCYLEDFEVIKVPRSDFSGVLLSTDGIYDVLSQGPHFHRYALQLKSRFTGAGAPLQPFCYEEEGSFLKDLSASYTSDDCTVVLALDTFPHSESVMADRRMALLFGEDALLFGKQEDTAAYLLKSGEKELFLVASPATGEAGALSGIFPRSRESCAGEADRSVHGLPVSFRSPVREVCQGFRKYAVYEESPYPTLKQLYDDGVLRETRSEEGFSEAGFILPLYRALLRLGRELSRFGLHLNEAAAFLTQVKIGETIELILCPEAVSRADARTKKPLFWQYFLALEGVLSCGDRERPVFSSGYMLMGGIIPGLLPGTEDKPLLRLKQAGKGGYTVINLGECAWQLPGGETVPPGGETELCDGLCFFAEQPLEDGGADERLTYVFRSREAI